MDKRESQFLTEHKETKGCSLVCNPSFLRFFVFSLNHYLIFFYLMEHEVTK